jgi:hypothetical protein
MQFYFCNAKFDLKFSNELLFNAVFKQQVIVCQISKFLFEIAYLLIPVPFYIFCIQLLNFKIVNEFSGYKNMTVNSVKRYIILLKSYILYTF